MKSCYVISFHLDQCYFLLQSTPVLQSTPTEFFFSPQQHTYGRKTVLVAVQNEMVAVRERDTTVQLSRAASEGFSAHVPITDRIATSQVLLETVNAQIQLDDLSSSLKVCRLTFQRFLNDNIFFSMSKTCLLNQ